MTNLVSAACGGEPANTWRSLGCPIWPDRSRTDGPSGARKTTMIVALARKLPIALWRLVTTGEIPDGVVLRLAA